MENHMPFHAQMHSELMNWLKTQPNVLSKELEDNLVHMYQLSAQKHQVLMENLLQVPQLASIIKRHTPKIINLANELLGEIARHLEPQDIQQLAKTNMRMHSLFSNTSYKFLECVAYGKQEEAEQLLRSVLHGRDEKIQELLLNRERFCDYSGRIFNCSAYEYAYWAKDTHMCRMLEQYMDENTKEKMAVHIDKMSNIGLSYYQDGIRYQSPNFNFTAFLESLKISIQTFKQYFELSENRAIIENEEDFAFQAHKNVINFLNAQRNLPAHVIQEYCRKDRPFSPCPTFKEHNFPRTCLFLDWATEEMEAWFPLFEINIENPLERIALFRGQQNYATSAIDSNHHDPIEMLAADYLAITHLDVVRTAELQALREGLTPSTALAKPR